MSVPTSNTQPDSGPLPPTLVKLLYLALLVIVAVVVADMTGGTVSVNSDSLHVETPAERAAFEAELADRRLYINSAWKTERDATAAEQKKRSDVKRDAWVAQMRAGDGARFDAREKEAWDAFHANRINLAEREGLLARIRDEKKAKEADYRTW